MRTAQQQLTVFKGEEDGGGQAKVGYRILQVVNKTPSDTLIHSLSQCVPCSVLKKDDDDELDTCVCTVHCVACSYACIARTNAADATCGGGRRSQQMSFASGIYSIQPSMHTHITIHMTYCSITKPSDWTVLFFTVLPLCSCSPFFYQLFSNRTRPAGQAHLWPSSSSHAEQKRSQWQLFFIGSAAAKALVYDGRARPRRDFP